MPPHKCDEITPIYPRKKKLPKNTKPPQTTPSPMPQGKELSLYTRTRICEARACGLTPKEIAFQHSINVNTVKYTSKNEGARLENASSPQNGGPRKIDEQTRDHLVDVAFHESPRIQWRSLTRIAAEIWEDIHKRSVQRLFAQMNMRKWKYLRCPALLPEYATKCLAWAQLYNPTYCPSAS